MSGTLWWLVPLAPLVALIPALAWPRGAGPWLWLGCLPAALAAWMAPAAIAMDTLWPGALWGDADLLTRAWLGFSALLWGAAGLFAASALGHNHRRFWVFWQLSAAGNLLLVVAADGISFFVGFSVMSLAAYGLVVHLGGPAPRRAGRLYMQLAVVAELLVFAGLLWRIREAGGAVDFATWQQAPVALGTALLLLAGFGIKAGFWPLHVWLPLAHPAAPAAASAVLSGAMIKAGLLGLWRFLPEAGAAVSWWSEVLLLVAVTSAFLGVLLGVAQRDAKTALAYSSVSQMGYLLGILVLAWADPQQRPFWGLVLAAWGVHHGLAKGALFLGAGLTRSARLPLWGWPVMALPVLALAGLPATSGALVKLLLKEGVAASGWAAALPLLSLGSLASALLLLRVLWLMAGQSGHGEPRRAQLYPWCTLGILPLLMPWLWPESRQLLMAGSGLSSLWTLAWPIALAVLLAVVVARWGDHWVDALPQPVNPALKASLWLKRRLWRPPFKSLEPEPDRQRWRRRERRWNRFWQQGSVAVSAWLLCLLLLLGWLW